MTHKWFGVPLLVCFFAAGAQTVTDPKVERASIPLPTPSVYATSNYGLTFEVPNGSFYCPLPADWVGSDHGTVIFLKSPGRCGGSGYPSSARKFENDVARIEIYYGYYTAEFAEEENASAPKPCKVAARSRFLGRSTRICRITKDEKIILRAESRYVASSSAEAAFTLITTADRYANDLAVFKTLLASAKACSSNWKGESGQMERVGTGDLCPSGASWF